MDKNLEKGDIKFEVSTPLGFRVRVTTAYWELIVTTKHPTMAGHELDVQETLEHPDEVRLSRNEEGFLITVYPTDSIKEGVKIWPK